jgi:hypothetical protein
MFEPIGGSAPKYTGQNVINPIAAIAADGHAALEPGAQLPEGTRVVVEPAGDEPDPLASLADEAVCTGIPGLAAQHDHCIYGSPKGQD